MSETPEFKIWAGIRKRCYNPRYRGFHLYGGRGIEMCERWRNDFSAFYADMGARPSPNHSVDRIDVNGNYEAANCRWATDLEQSENTRRNHMVEYDGEQMTLRQAALRSGLHYYKLYYFAVRRGMSLAAAMESVASQAAKREERQR